MDVKSTFLNVDLYEEVYIGHLEGFQLLEYNDNMCKLKKNLSMDLNMNLGSSTQEWKNIYNNKVLREGQHTLIFISKLRITIF